MENTGPIKQRTTEHRWFELHYLVLIIIRRFDIIDGFVLDNDPGISLRVCSTTGRRAMMTVRTSLSSWYKLIQFIRLQIGSIITSN